MSGLVYPVELTEELRAMMANLPPPQCVLRNCRCVLLPADTILPPGAFGPGVRFFEGVGEPPDVAAPDAVVDAGGPNAGRAGE